jgi:hypothetical protein
MSDTIGRITVSTVINSGQTFPLTTQYPFGFSVERPVIVHRFGSLDAKQEQRYYVGIGPRKFQFKRSNLNWTDSRQLQAFWESMQGPWKAFTYTVPNPDGTTTGVLVTFEQAPISFEYLRTAVQVGLNFIEVVDPTQAPSYAVNSTCLRFPSTALSTALLSEVQQIVPLVHIRVRESAVADIYLSDRRVTVGGQLYLPRLIGIGEPGSDVLISQDIKGTSDNVRFTFGNGDRVMTQLANDTDLKYAEIDLCLFHVNSGILLQLRDPHCQVVNHPTEHPGPAPDDGPDRLRHVGLDVGPERQPDGGQGTHQSVLDCRQHVAARARFVWRSVHWLESGWRLRPVVVRATRHVRAVVADSGRWKRSGRDRR